MSDPDLWLLHSVVNRGDVLAAVQREVSRAYHKHGADQWGRHEFYAILKEEVDELWDEIKADNPQIRVRVEAIHVMAMCLRYLETGDRYREERHPVTGEVIAKP